MRFSAKFWKKSLKKKQKMQKKSPGRSGNGSIWFGFSVILVYAT